MASKGNAKWEGDLKGGHGRFTAGEGISGAYSVSYTHLTLPTKRIV